jgi:hypothetical protein
MFEEPFSSGFDTLYLSVSYLPACLFGSVPYSLGTIITISITLLPVSLNFLWIMQCFTRHHSLDFFYEQTIPKAKSNYFTTTNLSIYHDYEIPNYYFSLFAPPFI